MKLATKIFLRIFAWRRADPAGIEEVSGWKGGQGGASLSGREVSDTNVRIRNTDHVRIRNWSLAPEIVAFLGFEPGGRIMHSVEFPTDSVPAEGLQEDGTSRL